MKIKLQIMTVCIKIETYHDELLCFILNIQALLICCQGVKESQTVRSEESIAKYL